MKKLFFSLIIIIGLNSNALFGQNTVDVNHSTGTANITIPLQSISAAGVSIPIGLTYSASGVRALDVEENAGMGWQLTGGGTIIRALRGLPDDVSLDMANNSRYGWMYKNNQSIINGFTITNDGASDYTKVAADASAINSNFGDYSDTEPDLFNVSAPGLAVKLVYDRTTGSFLPVSYQDIKVSYTTSTTAGASYGQITSFTITNDKGTTYTFASAIAAMQKVVSPAPAASSVNFFKTQYYQYLNGIQYNSAWDLTSITDASGYGVKFEYMAGEHRGYTSPVQVFVTTPPSSTLPTVQYSLNGYQTQNLLSKISFIDGPAGNADFCNLLWTKNAQTGKYVIESINVYNRQYALTYASERSQYGSMSRYFLKNIAAIDCSSPFSYSFNYDGELPNPFGPNTTYLPDSTYAAYKTDAWGYFNGNTSNALGYPAVAINPATSGYDRYRLSGAGTLAAAYQYSLKGDNLSANANSTFGSLNQITNAHGGTTTLAFEPNDYYDNAYGANIQGAGIRVHSITESDNISSSNNIVHTYAYNNGTLSSGRPVSLPMYAFTQPYSGSGSASDLWAYSTVRSGSDLSSEDHTIYYDVVTESQAGNGSTKYEFNNPATIADVTLSSPLPWSQTINYCGVSSAAAIGFLNNDKNSYPFTPNLNYDFERGVPSKTTLYNDAGQAVLETDYAYATLKAPIILTSALKYDNNAYGIGYGKYNIYTSTEPLLTQKLEKKFDPGTSNYQTTTTTYNYNLATDKLTQQTVFNSDGSAHALNFVYLKDYNTGTANDSFTAALHGLQNQNINIPIESYTQVKPAGSSQFVTTRADIVKYCNNCSPNTSIYLPVQKLRFISQDGITGFSPSTISSGNFTYSGLYKVIENDLAYDYAGGLISSSDNFEHTSTIITDHRTYKPTLAFTNANWNEVAFADFDTKIGTNAFNSFSGTGLSQNAVARTGQSGAALNANSAVVSATIAKNTKASAYILSLWVRSSAAGTITATISGGGSNSSSFNYGNTTGTPSLYPTGWQYCEIKLPLASIGANFTISFSSSQSINVDDIIAYPNVAEVSTTAYDSMTMFKSAETNTSGVSAYYQYDKFGRLLYAFDQDKNITQRNIYAPATLVNSYFSPVITPPGTIYTNSSVSFTNSTFYNSCIAPGVTFVWDFGDGSPQITTTSLAGQSHTYTTAGTYNVTLTATSSVYGTKSTTVSVVVQNLAQVNISYTNSCYDPSAPPSLPAYISSIVFAQSGVTKYTFSVSDLNNGVTVAPGTYTITIHGSGSVYNGLTGNGYVSVSYAGHSNYCFARTTSQTYTFTDDLSLTPNANFTIQIVSCP